MVSVNRRKFLLGTLLAPVSSVAWGDLGKSVPDGCTRIEVGYINEKNVTAFWVPRAYKPEVHDSFFRIVLDYSSMTSTVTQPGTPGWESALDIQVHGYPANGFIADYIAAGEHTVRRGPVERGYQVMIERLSHGAEVKSYIYRDDFGNNVVFSMPPLGTRDRIVHGFPGQFYFDCFFAKALAPQFRDIDRKVSKLLQMLHKASGGFCNV